MSLPIHAVLPDLIAALRRRPNAVLVAPPGAGKTTAVAPALLGEDWCEGRILLLSPRRLAARAAAERMAEMAGEPVGQTIGYATRMDSKQSAATRVLVLTEGIFRNLIQADPELAGVSAVLFDEVHERNLDSDFGLALALDAQGGLRPDLRLLAMSATLDGERFAALMGDCPVIESEGKRHPLTLRHIGRRAEARIEDEMAAVIRRALAEEKEGDVLAFLPGVGEIERVAERLESQTIRRPRAGGGRVERDAPIAQPAPACAGATLYELHGTLEEAPGHEVVPGFFVAKPDVVEQVGVGFEALQHVLVALQGFLVVFHVEADLCAVAVGELEVFFGQKSIFIGLDGLLVVEQVVVCRSEVVPSQGVEGVFVEYPFVKG